MTKGLNVYIPNRVHLDYSDARRWGQLVQITQGSIDTMNRDDLEDRIRRKLSDASKNDWVLLSGAPLVNILTVKVFLERFGSAKLLQWDGVLKEYQEYHLHTEILCNSQ